MEDFPNMCRVCEHQFNLIDILGPSNQNYLEMFLVCATVSFRKDDRLPKHLCRLCCNRLMHAFTFKQQCENTQKKLLDLLAQASIEKDQNIGDTHHSESKNFNQEDEENIEDFPSYSYSDDIESIDGTELVTTKSDQAPGECKLSNKNKKQKIRYKCDICRKTYGKKGGIERHLRDVHLMAHNVSQCEHCKKWFENKVKFRQHIKQHEKPFKCELCSKTFSFVANKRRHIRDIHEQQKPFQCVRCGQSFSQKTNFQDHLASMHTQERKHHCKTCGQSFVTSNQLYVHNKIHLPGYRPGFANKKTCLKKYNKTLPKRIVCVRCGKLVSYYTYGNHMQTHNADRPHKCNACDKSFKTKESLYIHSQTHAERRFKCDLCDLVFVQSSHLRTHQMVHTGEKPFKCEFCGKEFATKNNCVTHTRIHTGEKPFKCKECTDSFIDLNGLKRHRIKCHM